VINYRSTDDLSAALRAAAPEGIDVYFDSVGGAHLDAALDNMKRHGRIIACGMIEQYNVSEAPQAPRNLAQIVIRSLRMEGFIVSEHWSHYPEFIAQMGEWLRDGRIQWRETVREGLESAPDAFIGLFRGDNIGKMLVRLA
jgi:NADPH-dependent curcumin reductase CurA